MFIAADPAVSDLKYAFPTRVVPKPAAVFYPQSDNTQSPVVSETSCFHYGSDSETDSGDDEDEDTIVRWGWVWYKGEMKRVSELPKPESEKCGNVHQSLARNAISMPQLSRRKCSSPCLQLREVSPHRQSTKRSCDSLSTEAASSPRPSSAYIKDTPYLQISRKTTSYPPVHSSEDGNSDSDEDFDCEQVASFLDNFLGDFSDD